MQDLQTFINVISAKRNIHISILDLSGMLNTELTRLSFDSVIHSKPICDVAKSTPCGFRTCLRCKSLANLKAREGKAFSGLCAYGIFELAYPVMLSGEVGAVIYVGNALKDERESIRRLERTCKKTGVDSERMRGLFAECERIGDSNELLSVAEAVADHLLITYERAGERMLDGHWLVLALKKHAADSCRTSLSIKELAKIYQKNEKYLGRLFKKEVGIGFHEYCNKIRLKRAKKLIESTDKKIIDIAIECGFDNVSYFNRIFVREYGRSPSQYRSSTRVNA